MLALLLAFAAAFTVRSLYGVPLGGGFVLLDFAAFGGLFGAILQAGVQRLLKRPAPRKWLVFTTLASVLGAAHLVFAPTAPAVLLLVVDCLRADRLSEERMPETWALAQSSVRFSHAHAQSSWTRSAMPSLLSGRFPAEHGSYRTRPTPDRIREDVPLLAELFSQQGWLTAAFVEQAQLDGAFVIGPDGTVEAAARYIDASAENVSVSKGLGARHWAAAAITRRTKSVAVAVSETSGTVRIFQNGEVVLRIEPFRRAMKWKDFEYEPPSAD